ncbi:OmpA family protein [Neisseria sp. ZJ106]|uniref:OmpA family protein n=1 Tax=Neisseria lisongii TaxID=2912188 RepID=A0ABY7RKS0_9NEIS|nr:OmpA family protein [Neisseria lisongii]MCF7521673.1 OmpA family protein [Neisseria lisongii]WCL72240.1 OmpA family protein [Neisseria lisongii]
MKDKPNEWVSISDLMSGVMAIVMLLLVVSVLQKTYSEFKHKQESQQGEFAQRKKMTEMLSNLKQSISEQGASELVDFNIADSRIILKDGVFQKGSACITPLAQKALSRIEDKVIEHIKNAPNHEIFVEGYTDSDPVSTPVTNFAQYCTVYDDNYTLSAARAREARKLIIGNLSGEDAKKIIVAGYGDSRLLPNIPSTDSRNRRVEIRFIINQSS